MATYEKSDDCLFREVDGEAVILNLANENYYALNDSGVVIWNRLTEDKGTLEDAIASVVAEFDVSEAEAATDARALVEALIQNGILIVCH